MPTHLRSPLKSVRLMSKGFTQVFLNGWMVYAMVNAVVNNGHPFIGSRGLTGVAVNSGASYAVWVHYCDKYLEFFDTYFMILRGKMDQVSGTFGLRR